MKSKTIGVEQNDITEMLTAQWAGTFIALRFNIVCNAFALNHPKYNYLFPYRNAVGILNGHLGFPVDILEEAKTSKWLRKRTPDEQKAFDKLFDSIVNQGEYFDELKIEDKKSFNKVYDYCYLVQLMCEKAAKEFKSKKDIWKIHSCFIMGIDAIQKYFELIGYWTRKTEEKRNREGSGKGQIEAREKRLHNIEEDLKTFFEDFTGETIEIDKGEFIKTISKQFIDAVDYPRHPNTIKDYKEKLEKKLNKKIILTKKKK
jgi:hypothetical protein